MIAKGAERRIIQDQETMGKKKQEMSQTYNSSNNEFIFGENGGKGKNLTSFLKNFSLSDSSSSSATKLKSNDHIREANSNIYGNLSYGVASPKDEARRSGELGRTPKRVPIQKSYTSPLGASFSHLTNSSQESVGTKSTAGASSSKTSPYYSLAVQGGSSSRGGRRIHSHGRPLYTDLDDDWDADLKEISAPAESKNSGRGEKSSIENTANASSSSLSLQASPVLDSLYPDLTASVMNNPSNSNVANKNESFDYADLQARQEVYKLNQLAMKYNKFSKILTNGGNNVDILELRKLSWNGIPPELRAITWQILLGYLPTNKYRQASTLKRKRQEYIEGLEAVSSQVNFADDSPSNNSTSSLRSTNANNNANKDRQLYHQIKIDVKRTNPSVKLYSLPETQQSLKKVLFLWAVRHPASGYVQGINDLCTPFFQIFLANYIWQLQKYVSSGKDLLNSEEKDLFIPGILDDEDEKERQLLEDPELVNYNINNIDMSRISPRVMSIIEADTYWCLSKLLETITENYIHEQPGIIRQVNELRILISKIDIDLLRHLDNEQVEFIQFSFRWMNCLLMRELSLNLIIRMWDTYLSETPLGFSNFHIYTCAAFLIKFSNDLKNMHFQDILLFLQNPPTQQWTEKDIEMMLSEAFIWQSLYKNASAHLR